jgi:sn-glycerol 3-phosphate transport system permease protein
MATELDASPQPRSKPEPAPQTAPAGRRGRASTAGWYVLLTAVSLVILFPLYMTIVRAISNPSKALLSGGAHLTPVDPEWNAFSRAFQEGNLGRPLLWSLGVTLVIVAGQLVTSLLAAYAFAFLEFPLKRLWFGVVVATLLLPIEVTLVTNVETFQRWGWIQPSQDAQQAFGALTLPFLATAIGIFLIRQGFLGVPRDLRDAAALDGYGHLRFLWRVAIPVSRPIIASFVLISFLGAYNQYVWPSSAVRTQAYNTIQLTLRAVTGQRLDQLNIPFAAAIVASIPVLVLLVAFQRQLIRGLTAGAVKG